MTQLSRFQHRIIQLLMCAALFFIVVGARWWLIDIYGTDLPFWDQWDAEAAEIYKPHYEGTLSFASFIAPHCEHRIFFTRVLSFCLLIMNGQWDARLQMVVNSLLFAVTPVLLFLIFWKGRSMLSRILLFCGLALIFSLPFGWENTLAGFQSQFYFLLMFTVAAVYLTLNFRSGSVLWLSGIILCAALLFTMASGVITAVSILIVTALRILRERQQWKITLRTSLPTLFFCLLFVITGFLLSVTMPDHIALKASSVKQFLGAFADCMSWPVKNRFWAFFLWLPFAALVYDYLKNNQEDQYPRLFLIGMGLWTFLQAAAISYSRGVHVDCSRYYDILLFGIFLNTIIAARFFNQWRARLGKIAMLMAAIWLYINFQGLINRSSMEWPNWRKQCYDRQKSRVSAYNITGNFEYLSNTTHHFEIPYPDPVRLAELLNDRSIRGILPASVRLPIPMEPEWNSPRIRLIDLNNIGKSELPGGVPAQAGIISNFAVIKAGQQFNYRLTKQNRLPFIFLYFFGDKNSFAIGNNEKQMDIFLFPSRKKTGWHAGFAGCSPGEYRISGMAGSSSLVFMQPKDIGMLSVAAIFAVSFGRYLFIFGTALFIVIILAVLYFQRYDWRTIMKMRFSLKKIIDSL